MISQKVITVAVLTAVFIALVVIDGRRKLKRKRENEKTMRDA